MTQHRTDNDDSLFDRLVDGELGAEERRALLSSLDNLEDGWRRCALAFLEAQAWRRELAKLIADVPPTVDRSATRVPRAGARPAVGWLVLAAGLAVAFTLGVLVRDHQELRETVVAAPAIAEVESPDNRSLAPPAAKLSDSPSSVVRDSIDASNALRLWVHNVQGEAEPLDVPLVDATTLDRELGLEFRSGISEDLRQQLANQGYRVESRQRYAPLWLDQGRPLVVPVEDTKIVPITWQVY